MADTSATFPINGATPDDLALALGRCFAESKHEGLVAITIVAALLLVFSAYGWACIFVRRWRFMRTRDGGLWGTSGHAGFAMFTAGQGSAIIVATRYPGSGLIIALILVSFLGMAIAGMGNRYK